MIQHFPIISILIATQVNGDTVYDVIATCAGIPEANKDEFLSPIVARMHADGWAAALSVSVDGSITAGAVSVVDLASRVADDVIAYLRGPVSP